MNNITRTYSVYNTSTYSPKMIQEAVDKFKATILRIRDILRHPGVGITGMDSMRTICLYLLARYITVERAKLFNIPVEFAWESIMALLDNVEGGLQFAIDRFYSEHDDCLVDHFDRLFDTRKFSFDIQNLDKHKEILKLVDEIEMEKIDLHMDILGWVYEQHLSTGSSSSSRDLGQYFTDRFICHYMTDLCKPKFKSDGVPERVCDPTMGTGGFLTSYVKYFREHYPDTEIDWDVYQKELYGCDSDRRVSAVARLNMFIELGGHVPENMNTRDSLYGDLPTDKFDVILANMPFGIKGIKYTDCCKRVKELKLKGSKSEPLFLQLMMISLAKGGRCAVVVPDGMLVNTPKLHKNTRKYLIDKLNLKRVIKMKGKYFMNTSIEPSILYFENTGEPTKNIEFWDVIRDDIGNLEEKMVLRVPREKLDEDYSLDKRRYEEEVEQVNAKGYPIVKLGDVCSHKNGKTLKSTDKTSDGEYPVMGGGRNYQGYYNSYNRVGDTITISKSGASSGFVRYHTCKYWAGDCFTIRPKDTSQLMNKYLYYYLKLSDFIQNKLSSLATTIPHCKWNDIHTGKIPLPPLEIQQQIVETLDRIYHPGTSELQQTLKLTQNAMDLILSNPDGSTLEPIVETQRLISKQQQMVADLQQQMVALVNGLSYRGFEKVKLGDVCDMNSKNISKSYKQSIINYIDLSSVSKGKLIYTTSYDIKKAPSRAKRIVNNNDIIWGTVRPLSRTYLFIQNQADNTICSTGFVVISPKKNIIAKYVYYCITGDNCVDYLNKKSCGSTYPSFKAHDIKSFKIPLPPVEFQQSFVERLDKLQVQIDAFKEYQSQTEYNAKFMLESYLS